MSEKEPAKSGLLFQREKSKFCCEQTKKWMQHQETSKKHPAAMAKRTEDGCGV